MRIAIDATPALQQRGGVGRYARELIRALVQETLDHRFILSRASSDEPDDTLLSKLPPGAWREVRRLPASERVMTGLWQRLRAPLDIRRWIGPHDLFHATDFTLPPTRAARVVTIHDLSFMLHPKLCDPRLARYLQAAAPRAISRADAVIAVSATVAAEIATAFPAARSRIVAIPNGLHAPAASPSFHAAGEPTVLMVGTLEPRKNHITALRAMDFVRAALPEAQLVVVGRRGWLDASIVAELQRRRKAGWLTWHSDASDSDLESAYRGASVFVSASHYEGFGLPVLEAMARGIPIVASDIAAHREVAGGAAIYAAASDAEALGGQIVGLLGDAEARRELSARGAARAGDFSWSETARRTLRVYERTSSGDFGR